jgi:hypothetical protein
LFDSVIPINDSTTATPLPLHCWTVPFISRAIYLAPTTTFALSNIDHLFNTTTTTTSCTFDSNDNPTTEIIILRPSNETYQQLLLNGNHGNLNIIFDE